MTRLEAQLAIARAELEKAKLRAAHLRWAASALSELAGEGAESHAAVRQALYEAAAAGLDVEIAEARLAEADAPE